MSSMPWTRSTRSGMARVSASARPSSGPGAATSQVFLRRSSGSHRASLVGPRCNQIAPWPVYYCRFGVVVGAGGGRNAQMTLLVLVFLGGMLTILSPCILPVLPFVFARADQPFLRSGLPLLAGMALTFAAVATLAAVVGSWAVHINQYGRVVALALLTVFALTLLSRHLADLLARPFIALGNRLTPQSGSSSPADTGIGRPLLIGVATGLLWAPCAGPILGLVLTGAAISGPNAHTTLLLFGYAAGAAASLAIALLAGGRVFGALKRGLGAGEWVRRGLGVAVLIAVAAIAFGLDSSVLTRLSLAGTNRIEQSLMGAIRPPADARPGSGVQSKAAPEGLPVAGSLPALDGATSW